jgi:hypothetical protein
MIATIQVGTVLRETAATPYSNLITRPTGAAVRSRIEAALACTDCAMAFLDFSGVHLLDYSCADEVVAKLLLASGEDGGCTVVLQGLSEDQLDAIDQVLRHHDLAMVVVAGADGASMPQLVGSVTPDARDAFEGICECGATTAHDLARVLGWTETRCREALLALAARRVVHSDGDLFLPLTFA